MGPKPSPLQTAELFRPPLDEQINMSHPLVRLAMLIDWADDEEFAVFEHARDKAPARPASFE